MTNYNNDKFYPVYDDQFYKSGTGRLFVQSVTDLKKVLKLAKKVDKLEFENYWPKDLVVVLNDDNKDQLVKTGDLELDLNALKELCVKNGVNLTVQTKPHESEQDEWNESTYNKFGLYPYQLAKVNS